MGVDNAVARHLGDNVVTGPADLDVGTGRYLVPLGDVHFTEDVIVIGVGEDPVRQSGAEVLPRLRGTRRHSVSTTHFTPPFSRHTRRARLGSESTPSPFHAVTGRVSALRQVDGL
ncbi:hypothetical protein NLS1_21800 [Nocardioides sp. LS1]|nr:hypothetical protein NLS1_21800 [Nocardioides sp. LS1]